MKKVYKKIIYLVAVTILFNSFSFASPKDNTPRVDETRKVYDFADLLEAVAQTGIERIRFTTSHPWNFTNRMIDVIAKYDNLMPFIHLPVQSGDNDVLVKMNRRYTIEEYKRLGLLHYFCRNFVYYIEGGGVLGFAYVAGGIPSSFIHSH